MSAQPIDFADVEILTFDCYGTLIDWEAGIIEALRETLGAAQSDDELLEAYASEEAPLEAGPWLPYRDVLRIAMRAVCRTFGHEPTDAEAARFGDSVRRWPPFSDSASALAALGRRFELGVLTNCDDDLFGASSERLGRPFKWAITAERVRSYKPGHAHFEAAMERIGSRTEAWVHVAQSLYHDHAPANSMGIKTVWINRRHDRLGSGATPTAAAQPTLEVPDMATFAKVATPSFRSSQEPSDERRLDRQ